jgi:biopolymer transport protein ExbD
MHPAPSINMTPMIDVLLVLLIIFMVAAPTRPTKLATRTPDKSSASVQPKSDPLMVVIGDGSGPDQMVTLNSKPMRLAELSIILRDMLEDRGDRTVFIKAAAEKQYSDVVAVIDAAKSVGASPVALEVD